MAETALSLRNVSKSFGRFQALSDVNLTIHRGDIYGLIGENGAGKSTIMRLVTGLSPLKDGKITLLGQDRGAGYQKRLASIGKPLINH
ncbi:MAG TPA: hypothetical protein DCW31_00400 [Lactobacillus sp.]|nr:hypothetical protein [Lactobacillus sp.]